jgi:Tfp pilus assembly protein PilO
MGKTTFRSVAVTGVFLILTLFWVSYFIAKPQWDKYSENKSLLAKADMDHESLKRALSSLQGFVDSYKQQSENVAVVNLSLPLKSQDLANFASSVGELARASGILLQNFSIVETQAKEKAQSENVMQSIDIGLAATGSYPSFKDFILRLESHQRVMDVYHVSLKQDDNGTVQYQINLKTYYQK